MKMGIGILIGIGVYTAVVCTVFGSRTVLQRNQNVVVSVCEPTIAVQAQETVELPLKIGQTGLVAESLTTYEGPFLEDGTYEEVVDVAALVVRNTTDSFLESVQIHVNTTDGVLDFAGTWLPPGGTCVLLERNRVMYSYVPVLSIHGKVAAAENGDTLSQLVFSEEEDGIHITNTSPRDAGRICVRYKTYLLQTDQYMGGITNEAQLENLPAGETAVLMPPYYVKDYSRVVTVEEVG